MLAVHFVGGGRITLDDVPRPQPEGREVVLRVKAAAICGTDRENLEGPGQTTIPGHESAGQVVAVDEPTWIEIGDRVAVNCHVACGGCRHCLNGDLYFCDDLTVIGVDRDGGFAEFVLVPESSCMSLPEDISYEVGALLVDMLGTPFRAAKRAHLLPGDQVAIWGAGPIGLGELMVTTWLGSRAAVIEPSPLRREMARDLGADLVLDPARDDIVTDLLDWTSGEGVQVAFDCAGRQAVADQALAALRERGTLVVVGVSTELTLNPWEDLICREVTVLGTRNFNVSAFHEMMAMVRRGLPVGRAVTHRFPLADAQQAFARFCSGECGKILLEP